MKRIEAKDQVRLSIYKCFEICVNGVYYRLFRSLVTISIVVLTVAFFSNVVTEGIMTHGVARGVQQEMQIKRGDARFLAKLTEVETVAEFVERLGRTVPGTPAYRELAGVTGAAPARIGDLVSFSTRLLTYRKFFDDRLTFGKRRILLGGKTGLAAFEYLLDPENFDLFRKRLSELKSLRLPGTPDDLYGLLREYLGRMKEIEALRAQYEKAVKTIAAAYPLAVLKEKIVAGDSGVLNLVRKLGFQVDEAEYRRISGQLADTERILRLSKSLQNFTFKTRFINRFSILAKQYTPKQVMKKLKSRSNAAWFVQQAQDIPLPVDFDAQEVRRLAREFLARASLREVERVLNTKGDWREGIDRKTIWLMVVSFVVCTVGIANAMLISVAERFREIATMKCLGALDGFVMVLFVMEAGLFGLAGGVLGVVLGLLLSLLKQFLSFGRYALAYFPAAHVAGGIGAALLIGMLIATIAALYPSWVASRMAPMEAMRVE
ncbi:MAG: FtsX-like permease family protein [Kiritimatiellaeota bacterium]|nr:FtsX-like permease family protein [Kiritimatiellota bacterium]